LGGRKFGFFVRVYDWYEEIVGCGGACGFPPSSRRAGNKEGVGMAVFKPVLAIRAF